MRRSASQPAACKRIKVEPVEPGLAEDMQNDVADSARAASALREAWSLEPYDELTTESALGIPPKPHT